MQHVVCGTGVGEMRRSFHIYLKTQIDHSFENIPNVKTRRFVHACEKESFLLAVI